MKAASISDIKKELSTRDTAELRDLCLRMAKYKKDNKELLMYLLYESDDENAYVENVKADIDELFVDVRKENLYYAKKNLRRILRMVNKQIRYSGVAQTELELRIYFCSTLKSSGIRFKDSPVLVNLYQQQLKKIHATLAKLGEDLQYDYMQSIADLA